MKKAEKKKNPLLASLGDLNRPLRVRPVRYLGLEWWAVEAEDTWPGMVMDLRRLGFEATAMGAEVLVREPNAVYEPLMEGPANPEGLKPFPTIHPTIQIRKEVPLTSTGYEELEYLDDEDEIEDEDDLEEPENLDEEED